MNLPASHDLLRGIVDPHAVPHKTERGLDEMQRKTRLLSPRHRSFLILVDGHRPLSELLTMAKMVGSNDTHFHDLLAMGMIAVPVEEPAAEVVEEPVASDEPPVDNDLPVAQEPPIAKEAADKEPVAKELVAKEPVVQEPSAFEPAAPETVAKPPAPAPAPAVAVGARRGFEDGRIEPTFDAMPFEAEAVAPVGEPVAEPAPPVETASLPVETPAADDERPLELDSLLADADEAWTAEAEESIEEMMGKARVLMLQVLDTDTARHLGHFRQRINAASSVDELSDIVFGIERELNRSKRSHEKRLRLEQAREVLGLGNTTVREDLEWAG